MKVLEKRLLAPNETNSAPELIGETSGNTLVSVTENELIGKMIVVLSATDADGDLLSVHLMPDGNEDGVFAVNEGALTVAQRIDYETHRDFHLRLAFFDGIDLTIANVSTFSALTRHHKCRKPWEGRGREEGVPSAQASHSLTFCFSLPSLSLCRSRSTS